MLTVVAAAAFAFALHAVRSDPTLFKYDPHAVLGLAPGGAGVSDTDVRKAYRKLSLTLHPDKGGDAAAFHEVARAYRALTDEEAKRNMAEFGNPEGTWLNGVDMGWLGGGRRGARGGSGSGGSGGGGNKGVLAAYGAAIVIGAGLVWFCQSSTRRGLKDVRPPAMAYDPDADLRDEDSDEDSDDGRRRPRGAPRPVVDVPLPPGVDGAALTPQQRKELDKLVLKRGSGNVSAKDIARAINRAKSK